MPERIPAVNIQLAFKAAGKMNPFFHEAQLRLGTSDIDQRYPEMLKWHTDQGIKRVSVLKDFSLLSCIGASLPPFSHTYGHL